MLSTEIASHLLKLSCVEFLLFLPLLAKGEDSGLVVIPNFKWLSSSKLLVSLSTHAYIESLILELGPCWLRFHYSAFHNCRADGFGVFLPPFLGKISLNIWSM